MDSFRSLYAIEPGEIDLCTFPLFALFAPALGMTAIVPDMDPTRPARVDPAKIFEAIDDFGVTNLFGSPALLRRLAQGAEALSHAAADPETGHLGGCRPSRRRSWNDWLACSTGRLRSTRPMARPKHCRSHRSAATRSLGETRHATDQGMGVCVGRPVAGIDARIIADPRRSDSHLVRRLARARRRDRRDRRGRPGRDSRVLQPPEATSLAKIADPPGGRFIIAWATWAIATTRAGSGSAGGSRTA